MNEDADPETPENLVDLIGKLAEPGEPPAVSMAPQTFGWVVLVIVVLGLLAWLAFAGWRKWRANAYRRAALAELDAAGGDAAAIAAVLRRCALVAWPREQVAGLVGAQWIGFLDKTGGDGQFASEACRGMLLAPYRQDITASTPEFRQAVARWIRKHKVLPVETEA
ncbi:DUF4381 domain-containing protein [Hoeflea sp. WL0058]|uniref:DUF4381 domain-containing protein n=1 Tax=Flavimaribacter sediminis TaxID=2865987 RepID=A0AAE2ZKL7_9HYPH|nr:DUF4381 domain-containing protein [Flavimaribacter sediminis]MBW8636295.1 DUF4381 domain-containing protein [Flavimaribacter sediminis]